MWYRNPLPNLVGAKWTGTLADEEQGPVIGYRYDGKFEIRSPGPIPVVGGTLDNLYHSTPYVKEIMDSNKILPAGGGGRSVLGGGGGRTEAVSANNSLPAACFLAVCIAEAILVCKGNIGLAEIRERAIKLGIPLYGKDGFYFWWSIYCSDEIYRHSRKDNYPHIETPQGELVDFETLYEAAIAGKKFYHSFLLDPPVTDWVDISDDLKDHTAFNAYRALLRSGSENKIIPDPGFFSDSPKRFKILDVNNVGVIKCKLHNAVWIKRGFYGDIPDGAFTYIGHDRSEFIPDNDEYKIYDVNNLEIEYSYNLEDCLEELDFARKPYFNLFGKTSFVKTMNRRNPYPGGLDAYGLRRLEKPIFIGHISPLYHATTAASKIIEEGFKPRILLEGREALGGGPAEAISFTQNLELACTIAAHLKNCVKISQGLITVQDIVSLAQQEGILEKTASLWISSGNVTAYTHEDPMYYVEKLVSGYITTYVKGLAMCVDELSPNEHLHRGNRTWTGGDGRERFTGIYFTTPTELAYRQELLKFYNSFIWSLERCENPVFWGLDVKNFLNINLDDVAVIEASMNDAVLYPASDAYQCVVAVRKHKKPLSGSISYEPAMDEYRVYDPSKLTVTGIISCPEGIC